MKERRIKQRDAAGILGIRPKRCLQNEFRRFWGFRDMIPINTGSRHRLPVDTPSYFPSITFNM